MPSRLPALAKQLLDRPIYVLLETRDADGGPHRCVVWAVLDGDDVLLSTTPDRRKYRNMRRDPRVTVTLTDPLDPTRVVALSGQVTVTEAGGDELIDRLSRRYTGMPWHSFRPERRLVVRLRVTDVVGG